MTHGRAPREGAMLIIIDTSGIDTFFSRDSFVCAFMLFPT